MFPSFFYLFLFLFFFFFASEKILRTPLLQLLLFLYAIENLHLYQNVGVVARKKNFSFPSFLFFPLLFSHFGKERPSEEQARAYTRIAIFSPPNNQISLIYPYLRVFHFLSFFLFFFLRIMYACVCVRVCMCGFLDQSISR